MIKIYIFSEQSYPGCVPGASSPCAKHNWAIQVSLGSSHRLIPHWSQPVLLCRAATGSIISTIYRPPSKSPLDYYTLHNSWSFPFNWISKDFFRKRKNSWKNKKWSIFGHSVRVWSIFSKTPVAALELYLQGVLFTGPTPKIFKCPDWSPTLPLKSVSTVRLPFC